MLFFIITDSQGADFQETKCPRHIAPKNFYNPGMAWNGTDTGIVIDGFADIQNEENKVFKVTHGIDLSRHNVVDYKKIKSCGGEFAFLRVDDKYKDHSFKLQSNLITVIPYYFSQFLRTYGLDLSFSTKIQETIIKRIGSLKVGTNAAKRFLEKLLEIEPNGLPVISLSGLSGRFVALDVEEKLLDERGRSNQLERAYYGRSYARAVCSWFTTVKKQILI